MRKALFVALFLVLCVGFVFAADSAVKQENKSAERVIATQENANASQGIGQALSSEIAAKKAELKAGNYTDSLGQLLEVRTMVQNLKELRSNDVSAQTDLNITEEKNAQGKSVLKTKLRNGSEKEIKIMPDTAAQRALERLGLKVCSAANNCIIQLKDVGNGANETVQYEVQRERHSKLLGLFEAKMKVSADVDAETGNVIKTHQPWWAFMATKPAEQ